MDSTIQKCVAYKKYNYLLIFEDDFKGELLLAMSLVLV